jgi:hypothetical protein
MLDEVFAEAIVHKPVFGVPRLRGFSAHVILGLRVRPFSFWHAFNLDLAGYAADNLSQFSMLLLAVRCCRLRYPRTLSSPSAFEWFLYQLASFRFAFKFPKSASLRLRETQKFLDYRKDYADCVPEMADSGESVKLPGYLYHVALLRRLMPGLTKAQAWDFPIAEAQWEILAALAARGAKIDVLTPEDRRDLSEMDAEEAAKITPFRKEATT